MPLFTRLAEAFASIGETFQGKRRAEELTRDWTDEDFDELCAIASAASAPGVVCRPQWLLSVMWVEGRGARADAANPTSSATGLIQWMGTPVMAEGQPKMVYYGHTREKFKALGVRGQLPMVRRWFVPHKGYLSSVAAVYTAVFLPAFVTQASQDEKFVLCAADSARKNLRGAYVANKYFEQNNDGKIQVWELRAALEKEVARGGPRCDALFARLREAELRHAPPGEVGA
jgi:hypothetical protein